VDQRLVDAALTRANVVRNGADGVDGISFCFGSVHVSAATGGLFQHFDDKGGLNVATGVRAASCIIVAPVLGMDWVLKMQGGSNNSPSVAVQT
jgi:hypothetical protein